MSLRGVSVGVAVLGAALLAAAIAWWAISIPEFTGRTSALSAIPCLLSACAPAHAGIPAAFWGGLGLLILGFTMSVSLASQANEPSPGLLTTIGVIDRFTDWTGSVFAWMSIPLVLGVSYEVIARYLFNAPTIWAYDVTYMLYGALFMLGAAYALHKGAHIRTDFFWETFSPRKKGLIDSIAYVVFFFPSLTMLALISLHEANYSFLINETSDQTPWRPILWPFKYIVPIACLLLLIQGYSEFLKSFYMARTGVELEHKEKVEV
jgi:TRAP-type mannitol/chloroaromatic compound transport system permease small subunit